MEDNPDQGLEVFLHDGVLVKNHTLNKNNIDFLNNLGTLMIVEYKSNLGKCIEWHQCDVSIESDDQEWAIVKDSKYENGALNENTKNSKSPIIQIPFKNLSSFKVSKDNQQLTLVEQGGSVSTTFYFTLGRANDFVNYLTTHLQTTNSKRDLNLYIIRDQSEVEDVEKSFTNLELFSDDPSKRVPVWNFVQQLQNNPYETTMSAFCKVTDAFLYKLQPKEIESAAEVLNKSLTADELTDFHARISTEDYELITKGIPLPPRTLPLRLSPFSAEQWATMFDESGRIMDPNLIKEKIFHGGIFSEPGLKSEVWKFLLGVYPWNSTYAERETIKKQKKEEYFTMKLQWKTITPVQEDHFTAYKERKSSIEKDVCRTDRNMPYFSGPKNPNLDVLQDILMTYVMYNFDLGYVQGMSDLLAPLLVQLNDEVDAFWCFVGFMNIMRRNFDLEPAVIKKQFQQLYCILCFIEPELASYLEQQESNSMSFCFRWLLIWFKREFNYNEIITLWEVLWTRIPCENFHLLICAAILDTEKEAIMSNNYGFSEILKHVNELSNRLNLDLILRKAEGIYIQLTTAAKVPSPIREIIGMEPLPEDESDDDKSICNGCENGGKDLTKSENGFLDQNESYLSVDPNEIAFNNAISLHYL